MVAKISYSITNKSEDSEQLIVRSSIEHAGLKTVTDKDLFSFYLKFSEQSYMDTGLLPVEGSGTLSIRKALNHTQVAYQHAAGLYHVNWGDYEGDSNAKTYHVAQPYRIVIMDFINDNLLGARMFYSPTPITYAQAPLYYTNLPNTNCKGYSNEVSVGWICLYHTDELTGQPLSERIIRVLERCSGVEAYNNNNMSETDGTRFYQEKLPNLRHLYDPETWEKYSQEHGYEWTLDPSLWIPVRVVGIDNQARHSDSSEYVLTFADALHGNYKAYYYDNTIPKPVNAISRFDQVLPLESISSAVKYSYSVASHSADWNNVSYVNTFNMAAEIKEQLSKNANAYTVAEEEDYSNPDYEDEDDDEENY
jgi:hypothetical protein